MREKGTETDIRVDITINGFINNVKQNDRSLISGIEEWNPARL